MKKPAIGCNLSLSRLTGIVFTILVLFYGTSTIAQTRTASVSGNWSSTATWGGLSVPTSANDVVINTGITVTVDQNAACLSLTLGNSNSTVTVNSGFTLAVTNAITLPNIANASTSANLSGAGAITAASLSVGNGTLPTTANTTYTHTLTSSVSSLTISGNLTIASNIGNNTNRIANGVFALTSGTVTVNGSLTTTNGNAVNTSTLTVANATLSLAGATPFSLSGTGVNTTTLNGANATVNYSGAAQTVRVTPYTNLSLSGSGTKTLQTGTTVSGNLIVSGTATASTVEAMTGIQNLTVGSGATLNIAGFNTTINGSTSVTGTLNHNSATGTKIYTGSVTINNGGIWSNSGDSPVSFRNGITNNGTFTAGTGVHTFNTNSQAVNGTLSIPSVTVTGVTLTNNGTLTIATALSGTGLTNAGTATLNIGGTSGITTLDATASGNTVDYNGAAQTVKAIEYHHLTLSNSGAKSMTGVMTINGDLTIEGSATMTNNSALNVAGVFDYNSSGTTTLATSVTFAKFSQSNGEIVTGDGVVTVSGSGAGTWEKTGGVFTGTVDFTGNPEVRGDMDNVTVSADRTLTLAGNVVVSESFILGNNSKVEIGANTLTLSGDIDFSGGKIIGSKIGEEGSSDLIIDGAGTITGELNVSAPNYLKNFSTNRDVTLGKGLYVTGDITLEDATLTLNTNSLHFYGNLTANGGGTIDATGSGLYIYGTGNINLPSITAGEFGARRDGNIILDGAMTAQTFYLDKGAINNASNLTVNGSIWRKDGALDEAPASVNNVYYRASSNNLVTSFELPSDITKIRLQPQGNIILDKNLTSVNQITLNTGFLDVNGFDITINPGGIIDEQSGYLRGTSGSASITDNLTNFPNKSNPGGLGLRMTKRGGSSMQWGNTMITRGFEALEVKPGEFGINRYYIITPSNSSNSKIDFWFHYLTEDLNGNDPNDLKLYMSIDDGTTWTLIPGQVPNYPNNVISKTGFTFTSASIMITAMGTQGDGLIVVDDPTRREGNDQTKDNDKKKASDRTKGDVESREMAENNISEMEIIPEIPSEIGLVQNYPNPFNPTTTIKFALPESDFVSVKVFDITGREIAELASGQMNAGYHTVQFDGSNLSSGIYFYKITTGSGFNQIMKMTLIK